MNEINFLHVDLSCVYVMYVPGLYTICSVDVTVHCIRGSISHVYMSGICMFCIDHVLCTFTTCSYNSPKAVLAVLMMMLWDAKYLNFQKILLQGSESRKTDLDPRNIFKSLLTLTTTCTVFLYAKKLFPTRVFFFFSGNQPQSGCACIQLHYASISLQLM